MLRTTLCLVFACVSLAGAHAQSTWVDRIEILEAGIYSVDRIKSIDDPNLVTGKRNISDLRLIQQTTEVPARVGVTFGFRYRIGGENTGSMVPLKIVTRFPQEGLRNPARAETQYRDDYMSSVVVGQDVTTAYTFEAPWEAVPGVWVFEIWQASRKLGEQAFNVYLQS